MKIGLISDIHADSISLVKTLRIFKRVGVHKILCAGDLVEKGDEGDQVVALIHQLNIPCVLGNHDEMAPGNQKWIKDNLDMSKQRSKNMLLNTDTLDFLDQLPRKLRFQWEGIRILLVHGSPTNNVEYLMPTTRASQFAYHAAESRADVIIYGHTHVALHYVVNVVHFINPGSVCKTDIRASNSCAILHLPDIQLTVYHLKDGSHSIINPKSLDT